VAMNSTVFPLKFIACHYYGGGDLSRTH
jgi:hypothetical protein